MPSPSPTVSLETGYFVNSATPCVALIAKGVRFPEGQWVRFAEGNVLPWLAEQLVIDLFPALKGRALIFAVLLSEFDVKEFEAGAYQAR
jgi:hypothetical protein